MPNKLAPYKNPEIIALIMEWFQKTYGDVAVAPARKGFLTVGDLYQSFSEYTIDEKYVHQRLNANEFAKCIVACKIMDLGGRFKHVPDYEPSVTAVIKATV